MDICLKEKSNISMFTKSKHKLKSTKISWVDSDLIPTREIKTCIYSYGKKNIFIENIVWKQIYNHRFLYCIAWEVTNTSVRTYPIIMYSKERKIPFQLLASYSELLVWISKINHCFKLNIRYFKWTIKKITWICIMVWYLVR